MHQYPSDIAFTPSVKAIQTAKGSRFNYERMELGGGWETAVTPELESFLADLDPFERSLLVICKLEPAILARLAGVVAIGDSQL